MRFKRNEEELTEEYPKFCLGLFFGVTTEWVRMLYGVKNFCMGGFFWIDDVLISGL